MLSQSLLTSLAFSTLIVAQPTESEMKTQNSIHFPSKTQLVECKNQEGYISVKANDMAIWFKDDDVVFPYSQKKYGAIPQTCLRSGLDLVVVTKTVPCQSSQQGDYYQDDVTTPGNDYCHVSLWGWKKSDGHETLIKDIKARAICAITTTDAPQIRGPVNTPCETVDHQN
ncbi:hypothetical protein BCR37DRAFT_389342 [Protomyces lactucae-debilis]|uniref:Uncharacterized protein n=1 Tax=Protomyces lactucae-debilis TaxID=2754530 RepID=A0A1Y2F0X9_PROLT|nr:uncharacterized protein BCR37DRAFT_389342 [Protomyces lactucae-debilis]ORY76625.1 hypothetical protein BCR37DRAFT_389342 [Protomyces lactucae-debilis]